MRLLIPPIGSRLTLLEDWQTEIICIRTDPKTPYTYRPQNITVPKGTELVIYTYNLRRNDKEPTMSFICKTFNIKNVRIYGFTVSLENVNKLSVEVKDPLPVKKGPTNLSNPRVNPERWGAKRILKELKNHPSFVHLLKGKKIDEPLILSGTSITKLPEDMEVYSIYLRGTNVTELPSGLKVKKLYLRDTKIRKLPKDINVIDLDLSGSSVDELPEGLEVKGTLTLGEKIGKLPSGLKIRHLNIFISPIKALPEDIQIDGSIYKPKKFIVPERFRNQSISNGY